MNNTKLSNLLSNLLAFGVVLVIMLIVFGSCGALFLISERGSEKLVTKQDTIQWLESSNPESYADIKKEIKLCLKNEENINAEKVVFIVVPKQDALDKYSTHTTNYQLTTYYLKNGHWYFRNDKPFSMFISGDLDDMLLELVNN